MSWSKNAGSRPVPSPGGVDSGVTKRSLATAGRPVSLQRGHPGVALAQPVKGQGDQRVRPIARTVLVNGDQQEISV